MTSPSISRATCHCGAVVLSIRDAAPIETAARCDCSFCRRRQAANVTVAVGNLEVVQGADSLDLYQWGTKTAEHYFCRICGIYTHHRRRSDTEAFGVNVGCIEGVNPRDYEPFQWHDGVIHPSDAPS